MTVYEPPTDTTSDLLARITQALVPHKHWDNPGSADAMLRLAQAKTLIELGCRWEPIKEEWTFEDRANADWFAVYYHGAATFAESGPTAGEESQLVFYVPTQERLARRVRPDWTSQYFVTNP